MGTVSNIPIDASGDPLLGMNVKISLIAGGAPGFVGTATVIKSVRVKTDSVTGGWIATLLPNPGIVPSNTYYEVTEYAGGQEFEQYYIIMPDDEDYQIQDLLVVPSDLPGFVFPPPGLAGITWTHTQGVPLATWVILHNMGKYPVVVVVDSGGTVVHGDVHYTDDNTLEVIFASGFAGTAYLT